MGVPIRNPKSPGLCNRAIGRGSHSKGFLAKCGPQSHKWAWVPIAENVIRGARLEELRSVVSRPMVSCFDIWFHVVGSCLVRDAAGEVSWCERSGLILQQLEVHLA